MSRDGLLLSVVFIGLAVLGCDTSPNQASKEWPQSTDSAASSTDGSDDDSSTGSPITAFLGSRTSSNCSQSYFMCSVNADCILDATGYLEGVFPGTRRFVIQNTAPDAEVGLRLFFMNVDAKGTEIFVRLTRPNCEVDTETGEFHFKGSDVEAKVREEGILSLTLTLPDRGEYLVEMYADAMADFLATIDFL